MTDDDGIDRLLTGAGERWRADQPVPPLPDVRRWRAHPAAVRVWAPVAAVAAVVTVLAAVAVPLARRGNEPAPGTGRLSGPPAGAVRDTGDVVGTGYLFRSHALYGMDPAEIWFCYLPGGGGDTVGGDCGQPAVRVTGVGPDRLDESSVEGETSSERVRVEGHYDGRTLAVTRVSPASGAPSWPSEDEPPCPAPPGGWRSDDPAHYPAQRAIVQEVEWDRQRYAAPWVANPEANPNARVVVVGVKGDEDAVARARAELAERYEGELCVVGVRHNAADADALTNRLADGRTTPLRVHPDRATNELRVTPLVFDRATVGLLDAVGWDQVIVTEPLLRWSDMGPPPSAPSRSAPVEGTGALLRDPGGPILLCADVVTSMDLPTSRAGCGDPHVVTRGVDEALLTEVTTGGTAFSRPVRVEGTYDGDALTVTRVTPARPDIPPPDQAEVPCPPPSGGWALDPPDDQAINRVGQVVRADVRRYTDLWIGYPDGVPRDGAAHPQVIVVGVKGGPEDVSRVRRELRGVFSGNLCVHAVRHSHQDLVDIAERLARADRPGSVAAGVDVMAGRVRVRVVALDPPTVALLDEVGRDALIVEEPLLQWLD
jgi:hypothetical protein